MLREGHNVIVLARSKEPLEQLQNEYPSQTRYLPGDMADFALAKKASELAVKEFGKIDGLIVNQGTIEPVTRIADAVTEDWRKAFDVNFFSAVAFVGAEKLHHTLGPEH